MHFTWCVSAFFTALALVLSAAPASAYTTSTARVKPTAGSPLVIVRNATLAKGSTKATIRATVQWNSAGVTVDKLTIGEVRVIATDRATQRTTLVAATSANPLTSLTQTVTLQVTSPALLKSLANGNRVTITATQHGYTPTPLLPTGVSYVTVTQLQAGPPRGPVGRLVCSDRPLTATHPDGSPQSFDQCDFTGAALTNAQLSTATSTSYIRSDFTGANLAGATLSGGNFSGAHLHGTSVMGAAIDRVQLSGAAGTGLLAARTTITNSYLDEADFTGSNFSHSDASAVSFSHTNFTGALFSGAGMTQSDLSYGNLAKANLIGSDIVQTSFFLTNLTDATLRNAHIPPPFGQPDPLRWATRCRTVLPTGKVDNSDCQGRIAQRPVPPLTLPAGLVHPGLTTILQHVAVTNAGHRVQVKATARPLSRATRGELFYARLIFGAAGRVSLLTGTPPMVVRLTLFAPGDTHYLPYRSERTYVLR